LRAQAYEVVLQGWLLVRGCIEGRAF
jgi:hypothetical protein